MNQWFDATVTWSPDDGLKFYVNGKLVASDKTPEQLNLPLASEPFKLMIESEENGVGWSRSISIDEVKVWKMAMAEEEIKRQSEGRFPKMELKLPIIRNSFFHDEDRFHQPLCKTIPFMFLAHGSRHGVALLRLPVPAVRRNTIVLDSDDNWNFLCKEAYHIKRLTPSLNSGLKASTELEIRALCM